MNFYKRHLGDYAKDTGHLSALEHGVFTLLLDWYYASEQLIPTDKAYRIAKAASRQERQAVDAVLVDFFVRDGDGWRNKRADDEIAAANAQAATNRRIAEEREARRKASRKEHDSCDESLDESLTKERGCSGEPSQTPDSRLQQDTHTQRGHTHAFASFQMRLDWQPDENVWSLYARRAGLIPGDCTPELLTEFTGYWHADGAFQTEAQWVHKLVSQIKNRKGRGEHDGRAVTGAGRRLSAVERAQLDNEQHRAKREAGGGRVFNA